MTVAYVGCSNTWMSVAGYEDVGGTLFWPSNRDDEGHHPYGMGTILRWGTLATGQRYWDTFNAMNVAQPDADKCWIEVCITAQEDVYAAYQALQRVRQRVKQLIPGVKVYLSALQPYADAPCGLCGSGGPGKAEMLIDAMLRNGWGIEGPRMPALTHADLMWDGCHPNQQGREKLGQALEDFFG